MGALARNVETRSCFTLNQVWMNLLSVDEYFILSMRQYPIQKLPRLEGICYC